MQEILRNRMDCKMQYVVYIEDIKLILPLYFSNTLPSISFTF